MKGRGTILVLVSAANQIPLKEGRNQSIGIFLGELVVPLKIALEAGYDLVFASPQGKSPTIDKNSYKLYYWGFSKDKLREAEVTYQKFLDMGLRKPIPFEYLAEDESRLDKFDALFVPGGHAPIVDLLYENFLKNNDLNKSTSKLLNHFHKNEKPTTLICHAPSVLAAAPYENDKWIYDGYKMTAISRFSEWLAEDFFFTRQIDGHIKEYPTHILKKIGAEVENNIVTGTPLVIEDRELLTGQDPFSAELLGERFVQKLKKYKEK